MGQGLRVTFRHVEEPEDVQSFIYREANKLRKKFGEPLAFEVVVDRPHRSRQNGNRHDVRIRAKAPGRKTFFARGREPNNYVQNVFVALEDAFNALEQKLRHSINPRRRDNLKMEMQPEAEPFSGMDLEEEVYY